jgi:hypothetical protein
MNQPFYNTTNAEGQALLNFESAAISQEEMVLQVYTMVKRPLAWFEVLAYMPHIDQCSLKRCLTNLTNNRYDKEGFIVKEKKLVKTDEMITGLKGKPCHKYKLI